MFKKTKPLLLNIKKQKIQICTIQFLQSFLWSCCENRTDNVAGANTLTNLNDTHTVIFVSNI